MEIIHRCTRCGRAFAAKEFRPYMEPCEKGSDIIVRPDACPPCVRVIEGLRKKYPVDWRWFEVLRKELERKQGKKEEQRARARASRA